MMKKCMFTAIKSVIALVISVVILSGVSFIYSFSGVHIDNKTGATDYSWEPGQIKTTMSEGFAWLRMDGNGFNNVNTPSENIDILLMGSSHMEAVNVLAKENMGYILNELIPDMNAYNIGISGHTIYNCVNNMQNAIKTYAPSRFVILETSTVDLDVKSMRMVIDGSYPKIPSYDSGIMYWLQKNIPSVKSLYKQIDEWRAYDKPRKSVERSEIKIRDDNYIDLVMFFLNKAAESVKNNGCKFMIFYHPTTKIDNNGNIINETNDEALRIFKDACDENDIIFVDVSADFFGMYKNEHILAHGFINTAVGEGHLNKYGHAAIAKRLAKEIQ